MAATFVHTGGMIDFTPSVDVPAGDVIVQGELVGVAIRAIPANTLGSIAVAGVFDFPKATGVGTTIIAGANVYWNGTAKLATTDANGGANKLIGKCVLTASTDDARVRVRMSQ